MRRPYRPPALRPCRTRLCRRKGRYRVFLGRSHPWATASGQQWRYRLRVMLALGRPLYAGEQVDHVNEDRTDDRLSNLRVWLMEKDWNHHFWNETMALVAEQAGDTFVEYDPPLPITEIDPDVLPF